jgi:serine/threonine-protein kinase
VRDPRAAEALFEAGRTAMEQGDYATGCPKLKESYRLDPATGALYALALCHERQGLLASAWVEFMEVAARANAERNAEREQSARDRARALEPRLSYLTVEVDPAMRSVTGLSVEQNGVELGPAAWGTPIPIDPGRHVFRVAAPGFEPWATSVTIGEKPERKVVEIPELESAPTPPGEAGQPQPKPASGNGGFVFTPLRVAGIAAGSAGLASFGVAAFTAVRALNGKSEYERLCEDDRCPTIESERERAAAAAAADISTLGVIAGGVLASTGVILFLLGSPHDTAESPALKADLSPQAVRLTASF